MIIIFITFQPHGRKRYGKVHGILNFISTKQFNFQLKFAVALAAQRPFALLGTPDKIKKIAH